MLVFGNADLMATNAMLKVSSHRVDLVEVVRNVALTGPDIALVLKTVAKRRRTRGVQAIKMPVRVAYVALNQVSSSVGVLGALYAEYRIPLHVKPALVVERVIVGIMAVHTARAT